MAELQDKGDQDAGRQGGGSAPDGPPERSGRIPAPIRHQRILQNFQRDGFVSVSEAAREIGVSPMTIRRDLVVLARQRRLTRTHGGAMVEEAAFDVVEPLFDKRMAQHAEAKTTIARAAAGLVGPRESLGLDVGTSALALARELAGRDDLRIFTNNLRAAMELAGAASPTYVLGGQVRMPEFSVVGASAVRHVREHFLVRVFLGVSGLGETGIYDYSPEDTEVKRAFIESAGEVVVLCDASKFSRRALSRIAALDDIDVVITDAAPPSALAEALATAGVRVVVAAADPHP